MNLESFSRRQSLRVPIIAFAIWALGQAILPGASFEGKVIDAETGSPLEARIYLKRAKDSRWLFVKTQSKDEGGSALPYAEEWVPMPQSVERHTTVSAHPFTADLEPGTYELTVERGKEYRTYRHRFTIAEKAVEHTVRLRRWLNMAARGWYSGETHVHRRLSELPNVMLAEDLNVAFPVTFWTTKAYEAPDLRPSELRRQGPSPFGDRVDQGYEPIQVDDSHVIYPRNTEYEIFSINGERRVLGAVFILNHRTRFKGGMPPVRPITEQAHREGALLDLDKHSWPWAMMLVPIAKIDLYELSNNSVWRTNFGFRRASVAGAPYMQIETDEGGAMTEYGWLQFGFQNYYALLNCGFRLQPTAGTASGVHPVPLGYSRVYVHTGEPFSGDRWLKGLKEGQSFVTTGPALFGTLDGHLPGFVSDTRSASRHTLEGEALSAQPLKALEVVQHGRIVHQLPVENTPTPGGGYRTRFQTTIEVDASTWVALRCFEKNGEERIRFAHTAPWHLTVDGQKPRPRPEELAYLTQRVEAELARHRGTLPQEVLAEYEDALAIYRGIRPKSASPGQP